MGMKSSKIASSSALVCPLNNLSEPDSQVLRRRTLVFFLIRAWPKYALENNKKCPLGGTLKYHTSVRVILSTREKSPLKFPMFKLFFYLQDHLDPWFSTYESQPLGGQAHIFILQLIMAAKLVMK